MVVVFMVVRVIAVTPGIVGIEMGVVLCECGRRGGKRDEGHVEVDLE